MCTLCVVWIFSQIKRLSRGLFNLAVYCISSIRLFPGLRKPTLKGERKSSARPPIIRSSSGVHKDCSTVSSDWFNCLVLEGGREARKRRYEKHPLTGQMEFPCPVDANYFGTVGNGLKGGNCSLKVH